MINIDMEQLEIIARKKLYIIFEKPTQEQEEFYIPIFVADFLKNIYYQDYTINLIKSKGGKNN